MTNEKLAFKQEYKGFEVKAFWGDGPDARIEITKDGKEYSTYQYPAYRIFNIQAHFTDMVDNELNKQVK